jgi:hypothetical protein
MVANGRPSLWHSYGQRKFPMAAGVERCCQIGERPQQL